MAARVSLVPRARRALFRREPGCRFDHARFADQARRRLARSASPRAVTDDRRAASPGGATARADPLGDTTLPKGKPRGDDKFHHEGGLHGR